MGAESGVAPPGRTRADEPSPEPATPGRPRWWQPSALTCAALGAWVLATALGWAIVRAMDVNPLSTQGVGMPLAWGVLGASVLTVLAYRLRREWLIGVAAGGYAGWATMTILAALHGTPYGSGGLQGDAGRMAALATHFATTWKPTDAADPSQPAEYPPLFPMVVGRFAALLDEPGWSLLGEAQALVTGLAVVAGFLCWSRLVHPATALAISVCFVVARPEPSKANESLAMVVLVPLLLLAFAPPPGRRRLHPLAAGALFGLIVPLFPPAMMAPVVGIAALIWYALRRSEDRREFLTYTGVTILTAVLVASWYIVPLTYAYATRPTEVVADTYLSGKLLATDPLQLLTAGTDLFSLLRILGVIGSILLLRRAWWAAPLVLLVVGTQALRVVVYLRFLESGHAFILYYSGWLITYFTVVAGVLVAARTIAALALWATEVGPADLAVRAAVVATGAGFVCLVGYQSWAGWMPAPYGAVDRVGLPVYFGPGTAPVPALTEGPPNGPASLAMIAHAERLPSGRAVRFAAPDLTSEFNANAVVTAVRATRPQDSSPLTLSDDQRMFSFQPWENWLPPGRGSTAALLRFDTRTAELKALARIVDPRAFAAATRTTGRGVIDVFVLRVTKSGWQYRDVAFQPAQFGDPQFVATLVPGGDVVVVRRP